MISSDLVIGSRIFTSQYIRVCVSDQVQAKMDAEYAGDSDSDHDEMGGGLRLEIKKDLTFDPSRRTWVQYLPIPNHFLRL